MIKINKKEFIAAVSSISPILELKSTMPILTQIKVRYNTDNKLLTLQATDLKTYKTAYIHNVDCDHDCSFMLDNKIIKMLKANKNDGYITFDLSDKKITLKYGNKEYTYTSMCVDNYPQEPMNRGLTGLKFNLIEFNNKLSKVAPVQAKDDTRYVLNGTCFEYKENTLSLVATDGHRMHITNLFCETAYNDFKIIIPKKAINDIVKIKANPKDSLYLICENAYSTIYIRDKNGSINYRYTIENIDGRYTDYLRVIPQNANHKIIIDKKELLQELTDLKPFVNAKYKGVKLNISTNSMTIAATNSDGFIMKTTIKVDNIDNIKMEICFNVDYLIQILKILENDTIDLFLDNPHMSGLIQEGDNKYIVMPMKI
jgi:DNA polymerase-3 subunit beta